MKTHKTSQEAKINKIVYIAHPIRGNVEYNLSRIREIVNSINTEPKYATVLPLVPYYADVVSMNDDIPEERQRGIKNGLHILSIKGFINELWLYGQTISPGMKNEVHAAFKNRIKVCAMSNNLFAELLIIKEEWEKQLV